MENKKKLSNLIIVIVIIMIFSIGGYFAYDKFFNKESNPSSDESSPTPTPEVIKNADLPEWAKYVLSQDIKTIEYYDGKAFNSEECVAPLSLTKEELKSILVEMTSANLVKRDLGKGRANCFYGIKITYGDKKLDLAASSWIEINDENDPEVLKLIEKENFETKGPFEDEPYWYYTYEWNTSFITSITIDK